MHKWHFRDLWTEPPFGYLSVPKFWTNVGCAALVAVLIVAARNRDISFDIMVGFAISILLLTVPTIGARLIGLKWGVPANGAAAAAIPPASPGGKSA